MYTMLKTVIAQRLFTVVSLLVACWVIALFWGKYKDSAPDETSSYSYRKMENGRYYPLLRKRVNCHRVLELLTQDTFENKFKTPPEAPPDSMRDSFEQNGECPVTYKYYFNTAQQGKTKTFSRAEIEKLVSRARQGEVISMYKYAEFGHILRNNSNVFQGKDVLVVGTELPWVEAHMLSAGAKMVTTLEYAKANFNHPQLQVWQPQKFASEKRKFDVAVSYSSIEHSGLGRYGDRLNPFGDLEAVAQVWCSLKPGGVFILAVSIENDRSMKTCSIPWNSGRSYGFVRLKHLTANFNVSQLTTDRGHVILMMRKLPPL